MEPQYANIFFGLFVCNIDEPGCFAKCHDQHPRCIWIQCAYMPNSGYSSHLPYPVIDLVTCWSLGLVYNNEPLDRFSRFL